MPDWEAIVREHGPMVYRVAWRILGSPEDAEDVGQEVFLELHRLLQRRRVASFNGLLRRMTVLRAVDRLRRRASHRSLETLPDVAAAGNPQAEAVWNERIRLLRAAVARLPKRESTVFCLRYFEDMSNLEIADSINLSPSAVSTALHKARTKLAARLRQAEGGKR